MHEHLTNARKYTNYQSLSHHWSADSAHKNIVIYADGHVAETEHVIKLTKTKLTVKQ